MTTTMMMKTSFLVDTAAASMIAGSIWPRSTFNAPSMKAHGGLGPHRDAVVTSQPNQR
jgi:hypothetical protein